jgi:hypothetical protein
VLVAVTDIPQGLFCSTVPSQPRVQMEQLRKFEQFVFA